MLLAKANNQSQPGHPCRMSQPGHPCRMSQPDHPSRMPLAEANN
jgi:hypothetical protein